MTVLPAVRGSDRYVVGIATDSTGWDRIRNAAPDRPGPPAGFDRPGRGAVNTTIDSVRRQVGDLHQELVRHDLVGRTAGHVSSRVRGEGLLAVRPSGVSRGELAPQGVILPWTSMGASSKAAVRLPLLRHHRTRRRPSAATSAELVGPDADADADTAICRFAEELRPNRVHRRLAGGCALALQRVTKAPYVVRRWIRLPAGRAASSR